MTRAAPLALALASALTACADESVPSSRITAPRLLAIAADPPVATRDGRVALRALAVDADGRAASAPVRWRACSPWQLVRDPDIDCAPAAALTLPTDGNGVATLDLAAYQARFGAPPDVPAGGPCAPPLLAVPVFATVEVDGTRLVARKDVAIAAVARRAPALATVLVDGAPATSYRPGATHRLTALPARDSLDPSCADPAVLEPVRAYFYVTAGELDAASAEITLFADGSEADGSVGLRAPTDGDPLTVWTVLLDEDGGAAWADRVLIAED